MKAWWRGLGAEYVAAALLLFKGYSILAHRAKTPVGEIDLLARKAKTLVVVEVKYRTTRVEEAISFQQQKRLSQAAHYVLAGLADSSQDFTLRFDAVLLSPWRWPRHIENAWHEI